jgi:hypothetical protein
MVVTITLSSSLMSLPTTLHDCNGQGRRGSQVGGEGEWQHQYHCMYGCMYMRARVCVCLS